MRPINIAYLSLIFTLLLVSAGCYVAPSSNSGSYTLPSGRKIKLNNITKMAFQDGETALVLNYETEIPIENVHELRAEAEEVWAVFRRDVEGAGLSTAVLRAARNESSGLITTGKVYGFVIEKGSDGEWHWNDGTAK